MVVDPLLYSSDSGPTYDVTKPKEVNITSYTYSMSVHFEHEINHKLNLYPIIIIEASGSQPCGLNPQTNSQDVEETKQILLNKNWKGLCIILLRKK